MAWLVFVLAVGPEVHQHDCNIIVWQGRRRCRVEAGGLRCLFVGAERETGKRRRSQYVQYDKSSHLGERQGKVDSVLIPGR